MNTVMLNVQLSTSGLPLSEDRPNAKTSVRHATVLFLDRRVQAMQKLAINGLGAG